MRAAWLALAAILLSSAGCTSSTESIGGTVPFVRHPLGVDVSDAPDPTPEQAQLKPVLKDVPSTIKPGRDLRYVVELRNPTDDDVSLDPCPAFYQAYGESGTAYFGPGFLNCEDAPLAVPAGGAVRFEMILELPKRFDGRTYFAGSLIWYLGTSGQSTEAVFSDTIVVDAN